MAKDPAFLFYPGDWLGGTIGMTLEEKGAYIELLMMQFSRGHMTKHMIGQVLGQDVGRIWDKVKDKFTQDGDGKWYNDRLDTEKEKRKLFTASRNNNITGKNQHTKEPSKKVGHMTPHMENVNTTIPTLEEFQNYCKEKLGVKYLSYQFAITNKYEAWKESNWHTKDKPIKNWKTTILNTIPYLNPEKITSTTSIIYQDAN